MESAFTRSCAVGWWEGKMTLSPSSDPCRDPTHVPRPEPTAHQAPSVPHQLSEVGGLFPVYGGGN